MRNTDLHLCVHGLRRQQLHKHGRLLHKSCYQKQWARSDHAEKDHPSQQQLLRLLYPEDPEPVLSRAACDRAGHVREV